MNELIVDKMRPESLMNEQEFSDAFQSLTGHPPLSWQRRLYSSHFSKGDFPEVIDLPTGLGKTMVMAIWLISLLQNRQLPEGKWIPRRLIYVVDRRTVVDQATDLAEGFMYLLSPDNTEESRKIAERKPWLSERKTLHAEKLAGLRNALGDRDLGISTLRGQFADNREWSRDPSRPAIVIGTVDLIGSALLFSGYRSSYRRRPLEAGMIAQDSLLMLDEAHLSRPFEKLIHSISSFQKQNDKPMRVVCMSATSGNGQDSHRFELMPTDLEPEAIDREGTRVANPVFERFHAKKRLTIITAGPKGVPGQLARESVALAQNTMLSGKRIVVFVRKPDDAKTVAKAISEYVDTPGLKSKKVKIRPYFDSVKVLTGTMRGLERDRLVEQPILTRFLNGDENPELEENKHPVFLISTSAGEVGFDLNADHLLGDEAPLDSWIQRLGRVNRRGKGEASVILVRASQPADKNAFDRACATTTDLFSEHLDGQDVSPNALAKFKNKLTDEQIDQASSPAPKTVDLTDILLDAWSMTSIRERMPGRPEVGPWLRGIEDEQAQTTTAWRAELDLFRNHPAPEKALQAIFAKHPVRPHECLTVNSHEVLDFFNKIKKRRPDLLGTRIVIKSSRDIVIRTIQGIIDDNRILHADPMLILPASFGGLEKGMLSHEAIPAAPDSDEPPSSDVADQEGYEQSEEARARLRILIERTNEGWKAEPIPGGREIPTDLDLDPMYAERTQLINALRKYFRIRLVRPVIHDDEGEDLISLVVLSPLLNGKKPENQPLSDHVGAVESKAKRIAERLQLTEPIRSALLFAAQWHDEGKKAAVWQYFIGHKSGEPLGKGASPRDPKSLRGYRHEFGSLLRIQHPGRCGTMDCILPDDARDVALHLIATHHGMGRPHFDNAIYDQFTDEERDTVHIESIRRFARLQRNYGWWHLAWLENLLRCADALASVQTGNTGEEDETEDKA